MAQRGKPSTAHEYNDRNVCIYCDQYKVNIETMSLVCTPAREENSDKAVALTTKQGTSIGIESPYTVGSTDAQRTASRKAK